MAAPVDMGSFDPAAMPFAASGVGAFEMRLHDGAAAQAPAQKGDPGSEGQTLDALGRRRGSSIDSKVRHRRSLSPRPANPWSRDCQQRDRASTFDVHSNRRASRCDDNLTIEAALEGLARGRAWSATAGSSRSGGGGTGDGGGAFSGYDAAVAAGESGGGAAGPDFRPPLREGEIEVYVTETAMEDLDELFRSDEPGSAAWRQVPLRHRQLPYSFFADTASLGGDGTRDGFLNAVAEGDAGGAITPLADFPSPNLDSLLGTPMAGSHFMYPDATPGGGEALAATAAAGGLDSMGGTDAMEEDIIDQLISRDARDSTHPAVASPDYKTLTFEMRVAESRATDAMDEEFLSNLDLDF
jgi:hypothetical protein